MWTHMLMQLYSSRENMFVLFWPSDTMKNPTLIYVTRMTCVLLVYPEAVNSKTEQLFRMKHRQIEDDRFID